MANVYFWLGDASETTATVLVRSDTIGSLTLTGGANNGPLAVNPATEYGIAKFTVTGLAADTRYPFTVLLDGVPVVTGTMRTAPVAAGWSFTVGSCVGQRQVHAYAYQAVIDHDVRAFFALGDTPYAFEAVLSTTVDGRAMARWQKVSGIDETYKIWGTRAGFDSKFEYLQQLPGWAYLTERVPFYRCVDNHEYGGLDWDWTTNWTTSTTDNAFVFVPPITTQANVDSCGLIAHSAHTSWMQGNPANTDPEAGDWKPSSCDDAVSNHPPRYFRKTIGNVEFFMLDCYGHRDPTTKADTFNTVCIDAAWNAGLGFSYSDPAVAALAKTQLGPKQLNWLLTHLASSTATFKVVLSSKVSRVGNAYNTNRGWDLYKSEIKYILKFIKTNVTGVMWFAGDVHLPQVISDRPEDHCMIVAAPNSQIDYLLSSGTRFYRPGLTDGQIYRVEGMTCPTDPGVKRNTLTMVNVTPTYLQPSIYDENGTLLWTGYLMAGKNVLQHSLDWRPTEY